MLRALFLNVPMVALTATEIIISCFKFPRDGGSCHPNRENIFYTAVRRQDTDDDKNRGPPAAIAKLKDLREKMSPIVFYSNLEICGKY